MKNKFIVVIGIITAIGILSILFSACKNLQCQEKPKEDCICTFEYQPVCGCNAVTYGNACSAECQGITNYEPGECPTEK
ncbi:MAG: hypothetical protein ACFCUU_02080 [Cyclobacteriaceae bacterium]